MADAKPALCPKCGAAGGDVACPSCGTVFWTELAGWTAGLSAAVTVCLLVVGYAASAWLKAGAGVALLGCVGGLVYVRVSLLRAACVRMPHQPWGEGGSPLQVRLWTAATVLVLIAVTAVGFVGAERSESRPEPQVVHKPPAEPPAVRKPNPLPVAVTFRAAATGTGQAVFLTGAPDGPPLVVEVTTSPGAGSTRLPVVRVPSRSRLQGWVGVALQLWEQQEADEREREEKRWCSATVQVRPAVETPVAWRAGDTFRLAAGQAVTLTCPGYDALTTSVSVPLKEQPAPAVRPVYRPPAEYRPPPTPVLPLRLPPVDLEQQKRAREAAARQLTTSFRDSAVGKGRVLVLTNPGPAYAPPVRVCVIRPSGLSRVSSQIVAEYTLADGLSVGQKAEVGWLELDRELRSGDQLELRLGAELIKSLRVD